MLIPVTHNKYLKDLDLCIKRHYNMKLLKDVIDKLSNNVPLPKKNRNHKLSNNWDGAWECHIKGNWLLIYQKTETHLLLMRTGTHPDLFG